MWPRFQNVQEEKQHDWYKQMYKSLHRTEKKEGIMMFKFQHSEYILAWFCAPLLCNVRVFVVTHF